MRRDLSTSMRALVLATIFGAGGGMAIAQSVPEGQDAQLVSVLPAANGAPTLVGSSGELYEPSGDLQWRRRLAGGVSVRVEKVYRSLQGMIYAVGQRAPVFQLENGVWSMYSLERRGAVRASPGALPVFAVHRSVYELGKAGFRKIASAKGEVEAIWASSASRLYVLTGDQKLWTGTGGTWRAISIRMAADDQITRLSGVEGKEAVALTASQRLFSLSSPLATEISLGDALKGLQIHALAEVQGRLLVAGVIGVGPEQTSILAELEKGEVHKIADLWPLEENDSFSVLASDQENRLLVATERGSVAVLNADGSWRAGSINTDAPSGPPRNPGLAPAFAR